MIFQNVFYFLKLASEQELFWIVLPLAVATIVMLVYFERYFDESPGWNTHVANSLVLLFIALYMFRHIYSIGGGGADNFIAFPHKTIVSFTVLILGAVILFLNFEHFLPEKIARNVSSPLTLNLFAFVAVLFVHAEFSHEMGGWISILLSLLVLYVFLFVVLNFVRIPLKRFFMYVKKLKEREKKEEIVAEKREIEKEKKKLKGEERLVRAKKKKLKKIEKKSKEKKLNELEKQKREAVKLKKLFRG